MGKELTCSMHYQDENHAGRLYLETDYLLFRGGKRLKVLFSQLASVKAVDGMLRIRFDQEEAAFELGDAAEKCADKILHPPSRLTKLGIKAGMKVSLVGGMDADFLSDLKAAGLELVVNGKPKGRDLIFFAAGKMGDLEKVSLLKDGLALKGAIWIIYPKGVSVIREADVLKAGRSAGLKDTKVAAFSATHTALKFSKPA